MKNWIILFVRTGFEERLTRVLKKILDEEFWEPFIPMREHAHRSRGVTTKRRKPLFPGYVFVKTGVDANEIADVFWAAAKEIEECKNVFSILHYGADKRNVVMRANEREYWERLLGHDNCVDGSVGVIVGDVVQITSGALVGLEACIRKIDRHKRKAVIEVDLMGAKRPISVMLEIISKIPIVR